MSRTPISLMALAALLTACSAAAQNSASIEQMTTEAPPLGAPETVAPAIDAQIIEESAVAPAYAAPAPRVSASSAAISCEVRSRDTANGVLIQARAFADRDFDGTYDLVITKSGGGGSAEISQSGEVSLAAGHAATLGENEISVERGSRVRAVLTLRDASGQICRRTFTL